MEFAQLYKVLDSLESVTARQAEIDFQLARHESDVRRELPHGAVLLDVRSVPSDYRRNSLPFFKGGKFYIDEPYCERHPSVFVVGFVRTERDIELLVVDSNDGLLCLPRSSMLDPVSYD